MATLRALFKSIQNFFSAGPVESDLERYINSKDPQSLADVEFWTAEYDNERRIRNRQIGLG